MSNPAIAVIQYMSGTRVAYMEEMHTGSVRDAIRRCCAHARVRGLPIRMSAVAPTHYVLIPRAEKKFARTGSLDLYTPAVGGHSIHYVIKSHA